ncbi:CLUMA_CG001520, isoform A [Clunio marinus]|uniref:CLUMA_CG001520, isoform A n=1 Tax=Clunio marinus TaxID=568069 RepID=A0A1J1HJJ5_9DIPT|nr:CLUMA_CG001520, isoform A [Clunio marinus]
MCKVTYIRYSHRSLKSRHIIIAFPCGLGNTLFNVSENKIKHRRQMIKNSLHDAPTLAMLRKKENIIFGLIKWTINDSLELELCARREQELEHSAI